MTVNLYKLDEIEDFDTAIAALEGFVEELTREFAVSSPGQAYLTAYPLMKEYVGSWVDHLLYFGYVYESATLPHLTKKNIEVILTQIFPNKISLLDPSEADTIIPELKAFWQWLDQEYQHPQASAIVEFLTQIQPDFGQIMNDPNNFGIAKSFLMSGMAAGFDMTSEAGIKKFQQQYNQELASSDDLDLQDINGLIGNLTVSGSELLSPAEQTQLTNTLQELASEVISAFPLEVPSAIEFQQQLQNDMLKQLAPKTPELSQRERLILQQQQISTATPGTLLRDFQTLLDFIGTEGIEVGGKRNLIPMKLLRQLNEQLAEPLNIDLKRPQQKSYPTINGLYLLLRATGMGKILKQGKKTRLTLDSIIYSQWCEMNPVEQYLNLFEAWLIFANEEMLGEHSTAMSEGFKCLQYWSRIPAKGQKFKDYKIQENLRYYPEFYNLALMKLFGLVSANYGKPDPGKGWRVKSVKQTPWGKALMQAAFQTCTDPSLFWETETEEPNFGCLQLLLQPYFPAWQKAIALPKIEQKQGIFIFKVSWHQIWRKIAISSELTLWDLSQLILHSVDFDSDHLDMFSYKNSMGKTVKIFHPYMDEPSSTTEVKIGALPLEVSSVMEYLFDFGDNWEFQLQLEEIQPDIRPDYGEIIASHGEAPPQYPDWDKDWEAI
ncbi:MAG: plasmid pRiA4b ORF-3 family protein [Cyanobacteria bacterium J06600_6]